MNKQNDEQKESAEKVTNEELAKFFYDNQDVLTLPIEVDCDADVFKTLYSVWNKYCKLIKNTTWLVDSLPIIKSLIKLIKRAINAYFAGDLLRANNTILKCLKKLESNACMCYLNQLYIDPEICHWFRARTSNYSSLTSKDMKHIPFNKRGIIANQRYSINGIPCLYLGSSVFVCWEELERPTPDTLWINRYKPTQMCEASFKVLNLSTTAYMLCNYETNIGKGFNKAKFIEDFFVGWTLQSICSIVVKEPKRDFMSEYIIPQLIMQNLKSVGIEGVLYFSVKMRGAYYSNCGWIARNLAIPAFDERKGDMHSQQIDSMFAMSEPINMGMFNSGIIPPTTISVYPNQNLARMTAIVQISDQILNYYKDTLFYKVEVELLQRLVGNDRNGNV